MLYRALVFHSLARQLDAHVPSLEWPAGSLVPRPSPCTHTRVVRAKSLDPPSTQLRGRACAGYPGEGLVGINRN